MDRRKKYSIQAIDEALLSLLERKALNDVSISEICRLADVNRSTYYRCYSDPYSQLMTLFSAYFDGVGAIINDVEQIESSTSEDIIEKFCQYHLDHRKQFLIFCKSIDRETYEETCERCMRDSQARIWDLKQLDSHTGDRSYTFRFILNGVDSVIRLWLRNDYQRVSARTIAKWISSIVFRGLKDPGLIL